MNIYDLLNETIQQNKAYMEMISYGIDEKTALRLAFGKEAADESLAMIAKIERELTYRKTDSN